MSKLSTSEYLDALEGVETQFALVRYAMKHLPKNKLKSFFKNLISNKLEELESELDKFNNLQSEPEKKIPEESRKIIRDFVGKDVRTKNKIRDARFKMEMSEDRINQSELLLLVAHFESFMQLVHKTFLDAAPSRVFSQKQTSVRLCDIFNRENTAFNSTAFLTEIIKKEVNYLDREKFVVKAEYFERFFGITFGTEQEVAELRAIMNLRNDISHDSFKMPPKSLDQIVAQHLVSDETLKRARKVFRQVPIKCVDHGKKNYPHFFE